MSCCCTDYHIAAQRQFDDRMAAQELQRYREKGTNPTTVALRDTLVQAGLARGPLLDVGGGIGALTFELLDAGMSHAVVVDASQAYLAAACEEAERRGRAGAVQFVHGDLLNVRSQLTAAASVVTLDRVVCCYQAVEPLLQASLRYAEHGFALSYPRDVWYVRGGMFVENAGRWVTRNPFRTFVHDTKTMEHVITREGFELSSRRRVGIWSVDVYRRGTATC
jgi:magnesium-protoporphyrin O-methyltransferase